MDKSNTSILNRYVISRPKSVDSNTQKKMERNLQPEVVRIQATKESIDGMDYVSPSEAKRLLFEIEALKKSLEVWVDQ